jgi:hypothetical protein
MINIEDPSNLKILGSLAVWGDALEIRGSHAIVQGWGIRIIDIASPTDPRLIAELPAERPVYQGFGMLGDYGLAMLQNGRSVLIDLADPLNPALLTHDLPLGDLSKYAIHDGLLIAPNLSIYRLPPGLAE